jgi:hypothetical protein
MTPLLISIIGALSAITVSILGAWYANRNNIVLQTRKLKEDHYVAYIEALHNAVASRNKGKVALKEIAFARSKLFIIASEEVIEKLLLYEKEGDIEIAKSLDVHNIHLTELIKSIRKDLKITDKNFPEIGFLIAK